MSASSSAKKTRGARPALTPFLPLSIVRSLWKRKVWIVAGWLGVSAAVVGTAPESVIRTLSEFNQDGIIELSPRSIRVLAPDKLRRAHW